MSQSASPPKVPVQGVASPLQLVDGNVTLPTSMLAVADAATVATSETQAAGAAYGDLATVGPQVVLNVPTGGKRYAVLVTSGTVKSFAGFTAYLSFAVSGATTIAAGTSAVSTTSPAGVSFFDTLTCLGVVTLNAGANTVTAKYSNNGGGAVWNFLNRGILVVPLG